MSARTPCVCSLSRPNVTAAATGSVAISSRARSSWIAIAASVGPMPSCRRRRSRRRSSSLAMTNRSRERSNWSRSKRRSRAMAMARVNGIGRASRARTPRGAIEEPVRASGPTTRIIVPAAARTSEMTTQRIPRRTASGIRRAETIRATMIVPSRPRTTQAWTVSQPPIQSSVDGVAIRVASVAPMRAASGRGVDREAEPGMSGEDGASGRIDEDEVEQARPEHDVEWAAHHERDHVRPATDEVARLEAELPWDRRGEIRDGADEQDADRQVGRPPDEQPRRKRQLREGERDERP